MVLTMVRQSFFKKGSCCLYSGKVSFSDHAVGQDEREVLNLMSSLLAEMGWDLGQ